MNRADRLEAEGDGRRGTIVGFALTVLQRRLASSPEAIYQSLRASPGAPREATGRGAHPAIAAASERACDAANGCRRPRISTRTSTSTTCPTTSSRSSRSELVDAGVRRADDRRARGRDRDARRTSSELADAVRALRHGPKWDELSSSCQRRARDVRRGRRAPQADRLHRAPRHARLPRTASIRTLLGRPDAVVDDPRRRCAARTAARRRSGSRTTPNVLDPRRHRRRRRGRQPAARAPDGQLRPAVEPEPDRAALRPHPPHRPDRGLPPVEPRRSRTPARARSSSGCSRSSSEQRQALGGQVFDVLGEAFRGQVAARPADRGHPLRRATGGQGPAATRSSTPRSGGRARARRSRSARWSSDVMTASRRRADPRGDGGGGGPQAAAALHPLLLPRGVPLLGGRDRRTRAGPLRDHERPGRLGSATAQIGLGELPFVPRYARVTFEKELVSTGAQARRRSSSRPAIRCSTRPST